VARLIYTRRAFADLDRLTELLLDANPAAARETATLISEPIDILANHRLIGLSAYRLIGLSAYRPIGSSAVRRKTRFGDS